MDDIYISRLTYRHTSNVFSKRLLVLQCVNINQSLDVLNILLLSISQGMKRISCLLKNTGKSIVYLAVGDIAISLSFIEYTAYSPLAVMAVI